MSRLEWVPDISSYYGGGVGRDWDLFDTAKGRVGWAYFAPFEGGWCAYDGTLVKRFDTLRAAALFVERGVK